jgi:4-amino-4-deoxy-L-arabinose transferase-like glycosyltransferase
VREWLWAHRISVSLALILTVGACLRVVSFIGYGYDGDDVAYAELAHSIVTGEFLEAHRRTPLIFPSRIGTVAPAAASFKLFGVSERTLGLYPLLVSMAGIVLAYLAGKLFFSEGVGVLAALLHAFLPVDVRYGTLLYPDPPGTLWLNAAILLIYVASKPLIGPRKIVLGILAGLALGFSWLSKEAVLFSLPFVAGYVVWTAYRHKDNTALGAAVVVGFGVVLAIEAAAYAWYLGDPLYHFHAIERHSHSPFATPWFWQIDSSWAQLGARLFRDGPETILLSTRFGLVTVVAALAVAYAVFKGWRAPAFVGVWFVYHALVFNFGSHSLRNYMPLPTADRYLWALLLPAVLLTAALLDRLVKERKNAVRWNERDNVFWASALTVVLALGFAHGIYRNLKEESKYQVEKTLTRMLSPDTAVFSDGLTLAGLRFFWAFPDRTRWVEFRGMQAKDISKTAYVLVNPNRAAVLVQQGWIPPEFLHGEVPNAWILKWEHPPARLYWVPE